MAAAPDHPWLAGLLGDAEIAALTGPGADLAAMLAFETALAAAEARAGLIPPGAAAAIAQALAGYQADIGALGRQPPATAWWCPSVRQLRAAVGEPHAARLHFGATSQDVIDTALVLRLKAALPVLAARLAAVIAALDELAERFGSRGLMGRTRMQAAIPITAGARIASWRGPLERHRARLERLMPEVLVVQLGGAAGTLDKLGDQAATVRAGLAAALGLGDAPQWHSQRDRIADLGGWLATTTGALGKLGQDVALMAEAGGEIGLAGGGASSAMPHKSNRSAPRCWWRWPGSTPPRPAGCSRRWSTNRKRLGRRLDPRMAPPPPDADRDRSGPQDRPRSRRLHRADREAPDPARPL